MKKLRTGVMGCTGLVGRQFVRMLDGHPYFEAVTLTASKQSAGKRYGDAVEWLLGGDIPEDAGAWLLSTFWGMSFPT